MDFELDRTKIPQHVAIIMDGNGRWAMERGLDRTFGHKAGVDTVKKITAECVRLGVKYLTLYTFSTENWNRPAYEIEALMGLVLNFIEVELFTDNNVKFRMVGDFERLPDGVKKKIKDLEDLTADFTGLTCVVAMSYSSRWELTNAMKQIAREGIDPESITEETINQHLVTNFMPDPELLIRTGGELVSATTCSGRLPTQNSISATPTGPTSTRSAYTGPLPATRTVSAASERRRHRWRKK